MPVENRISIQLSEQDITDIQTAITTLSSKLDPLLIALSKQDRRTLAKMSDKTIPFVTKATEYADSHPNFAPPFLNKEELKIDLKAVNDLTPIYRSLQQLVSNLDDTIMLAGSEAYIAALSYYNSVKLASKMDVPDAKTIYEDLKTRFPQKPTKKEEA